MADFQVNSISEKLTNLNSQSAQEVNKTLQEHRVKETEAKQIRFENKGKAQEIDRNTLKDAAQDLESVAKSLHKDLRFEVSDTGEMIVQVVDPKTGEVIRTVPPEQIVQFRESIASSIAVLGQENMPSQESMGSILIDESY